MDVALHDFWNVRMREHTVLCLLCGLLFGSEPHAGSSEMPRPLQIPGAVEHALALVMQRLFACQTWTGDLGRARSGMHVAAVEFAETSGHVHICAKKTCQYLSFDSLL